MFGLLVGCCHCFLHEAAGLVLAVGLIFFDIDWVDITQLAVALLLNVVVDSVLRVFPGIEVMEEDRGADALRKEGFTGSVVGDNQALPAVHILHQVFKSILKHKKLIVISLA